MLAKLSSPLNGTILEHHDLNHFFGRKTGKVIIGPYRQQGTLTGTTAASKSGGFSLNSIFKKCETCGGRGAIECAGCKGTGRNKKNGNIFERWKCYECQGFGLKGCPECGKGGLTPEQRGER